MDFSQDIDTIFNWTEFTIACFLNPVSLKSLELVHWATDPHLRSGEWDKSDSNCVSDMHRYTLRCYCLDIWVWTDLVFAVVLVCFLDIHGGLEEEVKCQSTWQPLGPDCGAAGQPVKLGLPCRMQKLQQVWWFFLFLFFFSPFLSLACSLACWKACEMFSCCCEKSITLIM